MWTRTYLLCLSVYSTMSFPTPATDDRMMQPLSAAASGNYTISFMPLLTVLVNMFPKLLTRVRVQPLTATSHARKLEALWEWERDSLCHMLETSAAEDPCHLYTCNYNKDSYCPLPPQESEPANNYKDTELVTLTVIDECTTLEVRRCTNPNYRYNYDRAACEPTDPLILAKCSPYTPGQVKQDNR